MKIPLGRSGKFAEIDDCDYDKVSHCAWYLYKDSGLEYARNKDRERMHRVILEAKPGQLVDHKNGNGLNNKRDNIRIATYSENNANRKSGSRSSSNYLGVSKRFYGYVAICKKNGKIEKKCCKTEIEAAKTYNEMAIRLHGEFARLNKVA